MTSNHVSHLFIDWNRYSGCKNLSLGNPEELFWLSVRIDDQVMRIETRFSLKIFS